MEEEQKIKKEKFKKVSFCDYFLDHYCISDILPRKLKIQVISR